MNFLSIKTRVGINVTIVIFIVIAVISIFSYTEFKEALVRNIDYRLRSDAMSVYLLLKSDHEENLAKNHISSLISARTDYHIQGYGVWFDKEQEMLASSDTFKSIRSLLSEQATTEPKLGEFNFTDIEYNGKPCRVIWATFKNDTGKSPSKNKINAIVAIGSRHAWGEIKQFLHILTLVGIISIWASVGLIMWILRWALRPVDIMAQKMNLISLPTISSLGLDIDKTVSELRPFVSAWDKMITRLEKTIQQEKRFTADASHELRTPLAIMKSTLQIAKLKDRDLDYHKETIDKCLVSMQRMETLIDQSLELARCDEKLDKTKNDNVNIADMLSNIVKQHKDQAAEKGQTISLQSCDTMVKCNSSTLSRAISNILTNAIKYGPSNSEISVTAILQEDRILIKIHDCGGKISHNDIEFLFDRFYRSDKARTSSNGGVGLGLSLAKEIINSHGGEITVESREEIGTTFTISLPTD